MAARRVVVKKGKYHYTRPGPEVYALSRQVEGRLRPLSKKIDVAGSIRRKQPAPVDIDIVMIPRVPKDKIRDQLVGMGAKVEAEGDKTIQTRINGVDVDVYFADTNDYGAQLMTRTGPWQGNIGNRTLAKNKGLLLNQYGLFRGNRKIAGKTEASIYKALGKQYKKPEDRGK